MEVSLVLDLIHGWEAMLLEKHADPRIVDDHERTATLSRRVATVVARCRAASGCSSWAHAFPRFYTWHLGVLGVVAVVENL